MPSGRYNPVHFTEAEYLWIPSANIRSLQSIDKNKYLSYYEKIKFLTYISASDPMMPKIVSALLCMLFCQFKMQMNINTYADIANMYSTFQVFTLL